MRELHFSMENGFLFSFDRDSDLFTSRGWEVGMMLPFILINGCEHESDYETRTIQIIREAYKTTDCIQYRFRGADSQRPNSLAFLIDFVSIDGVSRLSIYFSIDRKSGRIGYVFPATHEGTRVEEFQDFNRIFQNIEPSSRRAVQ